MTDTPRPPLTKEQFASVKSFAENSTGSFHGDIWELLLILLATIDAKEQRIVELEGRLGEREADLKGYIEEQN